MATTVRQTSVPIDQTNPQAMSGITPPSNTGFGDPTTTTSSVSTAPVVDFSVDGGGGNGGGGTGASADTPWSGNFHADELIGDEFVGLTPEQTTWIRNELNRRGLSEKSKGQEFRAGLKTLASEVPGLQKKAKATVLFDDSATAGQADPLAQQLFFFKTVAPYLEHLRTQTAGLTGPLYQQAAASLPATHQAQMTPFLQAMQAGDADLQTALAGAAAAAPSLDALMKNTSAARQAANSAYFAAQNPGAAAGGGGGNLSAIVAAIQGNQGNGKPPPLGP